MPLVYIQNTFTRYDIVTINSGVATIIDITTTPTGAIGIVLNENYIAVDEEVLFDTTSWANGDLLYAGLDSRLTNVQPTATFNSVIGYVAKSNVLGKLVIIETGATGTSNVVAKIQGVDENGEFHYVSVNTDSELIVSRDTTAEKLNQYIQIDLLNQIIEQLTEQTKLLKKIYQ